ncbi:MAG TPA: tRNA lysidine(34) synthetase TilS [Vicinamibacteria bacterium]|nr:tRNA lysidine(34) synthetase TilS [Vicinamibacteria bacterium]
MRRTPVEVAVRRSLRDLGLPSAGRGMVVGLSGGADSVALLDVLVSLAATQGFPLIAAHLDHGLRPDSAADVLFCQALCQRLGVALRTGPADVRGRAERDRSGIEDAARVERYAFLRAVKQAEAAESIAVAHTRDDQAETFLLRLLRGAGSVGLGAMRPRAGDLVRPLLGTSRRQVLQHLETRGLPWRQDPTNADTSLLRNRVRSELIPYLEARFNPALRETLARTAHLLADEACALLPAVETLWSRVATKQAETVTLSRVALGAAPRALARAVVRRAIAEVGGLKSVQSAHLERIVDLGCSAAPSGRRLPLPGGREAVFRFGEIVIGPRRQAPHPFAFPLAVPGQVELPGGWTVVARPDGGPAVSQEWSAVVPRPAGPLEVRTRRPGDRIVLREREESLKRLLIRGKVPADRRGGLPLVASGNRVLWVPGQRLASSAAGSRRYVRLEMVASRAKRSGADAGTKTA